MKSNEEIEEKSNEVVIPDIIDEAFGEFEDDSVNFNDFEPRTIQEFKSYLKSRTKDDVINEFSILAEDISTVHAERLNRILGNATDSEFVKIYMKLLDYVKPRLKAVEAKTVDEPSNNVINVQIINNINQIKNE